MFTTFYDRTRASMSNIVKEPIVAIWAVIAIAVIVFISLGAAHPSSSAAVASASSEARQSTHSGN